MVNLKNIFRGNLLIKITSLNAVVIFIRLVISIIVQRFIAITIGEVGVAKIGQLRNLIQIITSSSSFGVFNGVVKYVSEFQDKKEKLKALFHTTFVFVFIGSFLTSLILFLFAAQITSNLFGDLEFINLIRGLALLPIVIGVNRVFHGIINGLSVYKKYTKIELISYLLSVVLLLVSLKNYYLKGALFAIVTTPLVQFGVIIYVFGSTLKEVIEIKKLKLKIPLAKELLAFSLMSFTSTILFNYIDLDIRTIITNKININEAGYWTAVNFISRNYMSFSSAIFTLYVIPRFARIYTLQNFKKEVATIYKTLLPLFGLGMLLVYMLKEVIVGMVYPSFSGMIPLFKWQLLGDFVRLATLVVSHQFLAKRMVKSFILTELVSLGLFYFLSKFFIVKYGVEGVVMAHFYRCVIYFGVVILVVWNHFRIQKNIT